MVSNQTQTKKFSKYKVGFVQSQWLFVDGEALRVKMDDRTKVEADMDDIDNARFDEDCATANPNESATAIHPEQKEIDRKQREEEPLVNDDDTKETTTPEKKQERPTTTPEEKQETNTPEAEGNTPTRTPEEKQETTTTTTLDFQENGDTLEEDNTTTSTTLDLQENGDTPEKTATTTLDLQENGDTLEEETDTTTTLDLQENGDTLEEDISLEIRPIERPRFYLRPPQTPISHDREFLREYSAQRHPLTLHLQNEYGVKDSRHKFRGNLVAKIENEDEYFNQESYLEIDPQGLETSPIQFGNKHISNKNDFLPSFRGLVEAQRYEEKLEKYKDYRFASRLEKGCHDYDCTRSVKCQIRDDEEMKYNERSLGLIDDKEDYFEQKRKRFLQRKKIMIRPKFTQAEGLAGMQRCQRVVQLLDIKLQSIGLHVDQYKELILIDNKNSKLSRAFFDVQKIMDKNQKKQKQEETLFGSETHRVEKPTLTGCVQPDDTEYLLTDYLWARLTWEEDATLNQEQVCIEYDPEIFRRKDKIGLYSGYYDRNNPAEYDQEETTLEENQRLNREKYVLCCVNRKNEKLGMHFIPNLVSNLKFINEKLTKFGINVKIKREIQDDTGLFELAFVTLGDNTPDNLILQRSQTSEE